MTYDPFFQVGSDSNWNACIGQQGEEENYIDGYIEAAVQLIDALFEKKLYSKRDTLVLPILYNARHGIELALKMAIGNLVDMDVLAHGHAKDHDIHSHWKYLSRARLGDESLRQIVGELEPFVSSLSQIDKDGQELRYHETQDGAQSMSGQSVTCLVVIQKSLKTLHGILDRLKNRLFDLKNERRGGFFTADLSRADLIEIAKLIPPRSEWLGDALTEAKEKVKARYGIGSNKFSAALDLIQKNRETRALIGIETDLKFLSDESAMFLATAFLEQYPPKDREPEVIKASALDCEKMFDEMKREGAIRRKVLEALKLDEAADARTIFHYGRDRELPETYEVAVEEDFKRLSNLEPSAVEAEILHVFSKTNFLREFEKGLRALGRASLAERLLP